MTINDIKNYFGTFSSFARNLNVHVNTVQMWEKKGEIPLKYQIIIEKYTNGALKIDDKFKF